MTTPHSSPFDHQPASRRPLNKNDIKVLSLSALGGALEFYDFIIFIFFASFFSTYFFPSTLSPFWKTLDTYGTFAVAYFMRPVGGIIMGHFGDLVGRKRMFTLSVMLMALPTFCIGLLPTFDQIGYVAPLLLLAMRMLQGIAIGGEIPGAWVFVSEHAPRDKVGLANGLVTAGLTSGILLGSLISLLIHSLFSEEAIAQYAWRIPFLLGGLLGIIAVYLRRYLDETPVFQAMREKKLLANKLPVAIVCQTHRRAIFLSALVTWLLTAGIVVIILFAPELMKSPLFHIPPKITLGMQSIAIICVSLGAIWAGYMCDQVGAKITFIVLCAGLALSSIIFYHSIGHVSYPLLTLLYAITAFFVGIVGAVPYVMVHAFPASIRFTGLSFSYNIAYALFGGLTPLFLAVANKMSPLSGGYYVMSISIIGILCGVYLLPRQSIEVTNQPA